MASVRTLKLVYDVGYHFAKMDAAYLVELLLTMILQICVSVVEL